jgi:endonuclease I
VERNEIIYKYQFTRNPFIDHPETISMISDF